MCPIHIMHILCPCHGLWTWNIVSYGIWNIVSYSEHSLAEGHSVPWMCFLLMWQVENRSNKLIIWTKLPSKLPEQTPGRPWGWLRVRIRSIKKSEVWSFTLLHKISRTACCFGIRALLWQYNCYEIATIWYTDHQYLVQYSELNNNLQEIPLMFCNYAVCSCGT